MASSFLWGVATSAYQIEGAADNDWTEWERAGRLRDPHTRCGLGAGHRQRWRSDFSLLASLRVNAYRYSLERSAIEPERGRFSEPRLALERERAAALLGLDIEPCVTLHHYTHPRWFWTAGGWESTDSALGGRVREARTGVHRGRGHRTFRRFSKVTNSAAPASRASSSVFS